MSALSIPPRRLGHSGLFVSAVGLGAGPLGDARIEAGEAESLVRAAVDLGITVIDTAPSYGASEERVGLALRGIRDSVTLVTKLGYGIEGEADWTPRCLARGIDRALERLATDRIDVVLLHSCGRERLQSGELYEPLFAAKAAGKVRAIGYSGDGEALSFAVSSGAFDVVECSVNLVDREALREVVVEARRRDIGVLAKRSLANAVWNHHELPERDDLAVYWKRLRAMPLPAGVALDELALRFSAFAEGVGCALVGTTRKDHLSRAVEIVNRGPLEPPTEKALERSFMDHGASWGGLV